MSISTFDSPQHVIKTFPAKSTAPKAHYKQPFKVIVWAAQLQAGGTQESGFYLNPYTAQFTLTAVESGRDFSYLVGIFRVVMCIT